ncbi:MAG: hypothetical protein OXI92_03970 [Acidobacteriota bacterium]|nr:hypothetical protein [Acidobacteriota bacterium]
MSRWEPTIRTREQSPTERPDSDLARSLARLKARERALEQPTKGQRYDNRSPQHQPNRRQERRQRPNGRRTDIRTGHRRELGRSRQKGPDQTERTHACLREVGLYRCASHRDLVEAHFSGNRFAAAKSLDSLVRSGAMQQHRAKGPNGGAFTVYTLTKSGAALAQRLAVKRGLDADQRTWSGMVKPREASHDADVAKACRKEIEDLAARGARVRRILIDAEMKSILAKRSEVARAKEGKEAADRERQRAAEQLHLPCDDQGHVQVPDAQIQYVDEAGNIGRVNVEVASDHYREASVKAKSGAGFSMHGGKGGQASNTRTSLSSLGGGGGRRGGGRGGRDPASVEL